MAKLINCTQFCHIYLLQVSATFVTVGDVLNSVQIIYIQLFDYYNEIPSHKWKITMIQRRIMLCRAVFCFLDLD